jgi:hypothetical protein
LPSVRDGVESAQDIELVVEDCEASGQNHSHDSGPGSSNRADHVGNRVVAEYAIGNVRYGNCATPYTINVWRSSIRENTASHVVYVVVRIGGRLRGPAVGNRIIFKRMSELAAS